MRYSKVFLFWVVILTLFACQPQTATTLLAPNESVERANTPKIATSLGALEAILKEIVKGTPAKIITPYDSTTTFEEYEEYFSDKDSLLQALADSVDMVVDLRSLIPQDQLYLKLRQKCITIVHTDCSAPLNPLTGSLGTIPDALGKPNPYLWTAPTNVIKIAEIITVDLAALYPEYAPTFQGNLDTLKRTIMELKSSYDTLFLTLSRFDGAVMDESFDYLLKDIDLYQVTLYPSEIDWDSTITAQFRENVAQKRFAIVIHRWEPFGEPIEITTAAGIPMAILNPGHPKGSSFDKGIVSYLRQNLEILYRALKESSLNKEN